MPILDGVPPSTFVKVHIGQAQCIYYNTHHKCYNEHAKQSKKQPALETRRRIIPIDLLDFGVDIVDNGGVAAMIEVIPREWRVSCH